MNPHSLSADSFVSSGILYNAVLLLVCYVFLLPFYILILFYLCVFLVQFQLRCAAVQELLSNVRLFARCDDIFLQQIMRALSQQLHPRNSQFVDVQEKSRSCDYTGQGSLGCAPSYAADAQGATSAGLQGIYLVKSGTVSLVEGRLKQKHTRHQGQHFGENSLFLDIPLVPLQVRTITLFYSNCINTSIVGMNLNNFTAIGGVYFICEF
jgi:hypothetical protein